MAIEKPALSDRMYAALLRILPFDFRAEFGSEMEQVFRDQRAATSQERGIMKLLRLWWETIVGIVGMAPREHVSVLRHDTGYALRLMRKDPAYTIAVIGILGLGIGVNTAVFSVVNSVLLRPLPYLEGDRIVTVRQQATKAGVDDMRFSVQEINDYRRQNRTLSGLVEYHGMIFTLFSRGEAQRVHAGVVSAGFFDMFGVRPILGRTFLASDDQQGAPAVLMLSHEFWKQHENGDANVVGKTYEMNDRVHTVIGVLPPLPQYPNENDVYMPTSACPFRSSSRAIANREARMMSVFARIKPGATIEHCRMDLATIANRLQEEYPKYYPKAAGYSAGFTPLQEDLKRDARPMLLIMLGGAAFVLFIACANVANLMLARIARRQRELIVRTALGAGSARILRQLWTEGLILALLGAATGVVLAWESRNLLVEFAARLTPRAREISIDGWVLLFAILCAVGTSLFCGIVATYFSSGNIASGLKDSGVQTTGGRRHQFVRGGLIAAQVAFSYVLLIGAGLMSRSLINLEKVDAGFVAQRVLAMDIDLNWSKYQNPQQWRDVSRRLLDRMQAQPGVLSAAVSSNFPLNPESMGPWNQRFQVEGRPQPQAELEPVAIMRIASPDYFRTLGIPLLGGRAFTDHDTETSMEVALISRSLAKRYWRKEDPVGRKISFDKGEHWITVVGIVGDVKEFGLAPEPPDQLYRPLMQNPAPGSVLLRTAGDAMSLSRQARRAVLEVDPQTAINRIETLEQARAESVASPRVTTRLFGLFALLALIIAITGIGCVLALSVRQRTREMGIRASLGADPMDLIQMVIRQGMGLVLAGVVLGLAGALALTRLLRALLFEVTPTDPVTFAAVSLLLALAALLACYLPARRAARIDPLAALRSE